MKTTTTTSGSNANSVTVACISTALLAVVTGYSYYYTYMVSKKQQSKVGLLSNDDDNDVDNAIVNDQPINESSTSSSNKKLPSSIPTEIDTSNTNKANDTSLQRIQTTNTITIAYASTTGTCQSFAKSLHESLTQFIESNQKTLSPLLTKIQICTVDELDWWDELLNNENTNNSNHTSNNKESDDEGKKFGPTLDLPPMVIFVLPTWTNGTLPEQYSPLLSSLDEICHDWRVAPRPLRNEEYESMKKSLLRSNNNNGGINNKRPPMDTKTIQIASFGMGSTAYDKSTFCKPAKDVFKHFMKLGAKSLLVSHGKGVVGMGDDDAGDCKKLFKEWKERVMGRIEELWNIQMENHNKNNSNSCETKSGCACQSGEGGKSTSNQMNEGCCQSGESKINENDDEDFDEDFDEDEDYSDDDYSAQESEYDDDEEKEPDVMDLEDIGNAMRSSTNKNQGSKKVIKEMVTPKQAVALKKEGYKIIGTHSAVKLCRWTKHQLRGRGGCYKHTFYGITSYQCMEATPSLACANKCK